MGWDATEGTTAADQVLEPFGSWRAMERIVRTARLSDYPRTRLCWDGHWITVSIVSTALEMDWTRVIVRC